VAVKPTFIAYIDESGDEGFRFYKEGCPDWFVLSAAIVRRADDLGMVQMMKMVKEKLGKPIKKPLHFKELKHEQRLLWVDRIAATKLKTISVLVHKPSVEEPEAFDRRYRLYYYAVRLLCERISWYCRDSKTRRDKGDGRVALIFSNRSNMSYSEMRRYLNRLEVRSYQGWNDIRIEWSLIDMRRMRTYSPGKRAGLQVADAIAGSFYQAVERSQYGFNEDRYARMLKPVVYHRKDRYHGYGIKMFPPEAVHLLKISKHLRWAYQDYA
jgi:hypothetical protein